MKMPSIEYIQLVNEFGKKIQKMRGLDDDEAQKLKYMIKEQLKSY